MSPREAKRLAAELDGWELVKGKSLRKLKEGPAARAAGPGKVSRAS